MEYIARTLDSQHRVSHRHLAQASRLHSLPLAEVAAVREAVGVQVEVAAEGEGEQANESLVTSQAKIRYTSVMKKNILIIIVLVIAIIAGYAYYKKSAPATEPVVIPTASISGDTANLVSVNVTPGQKISGKGTIYGVLKGAYFFEANARGMLLDSGKNTLKNFPISATTDWMTEGPVSFKATIDATGLSGAGYIRIANDNPSGEPARDKYIDIPVVFQ